FLSAIASMLGKFL
uniref:Ranatuerin-7 n=2 Tax=Aquarana catesbeiana TaxID=8400 RepID=TP7_AQUCT|nr:RecName: Full=Ranatuerin-7; AltName: Full=Temporin [Aquarana catesbeiana]